MIVNLQKTEKYIINWIKDYAQKAGINTLIVGLSGGIDSALTALLCKKTGISTICIAMPCYSSEFSFERAKNFAIEQELNLKLIDLTKAYDTIITQHDIIHKDRVKLAIGGLRSCLRAPTLSYFALLLNGLIVGTGNRSENNLIRYFHKYGNGCVDILPIADIFKSEVYELFAYMTNIILRSNNDNIKVYDGPKGALEIFTASPTGDLYGENSKTDEEELGLSYDEIEWADRQNIINNIINSEEDPVRNKAWLGYSSRQRQVIAKIHAMEKATRHKVNFNLPICEVRSIKGLVR